MAEHSNATGQALAQLGADFPRWRFLVSDRGRWWALRGPLPWRALNERDAFDEDTAEGLRTALLAAGEGSEGQDRDQ
ncbi:hypothetical protein [Actinomadura rupiterrae]|uniref:hypothetical protein n=1 Tax=Actinomadura rupiterrae TaxID=559627 RepID=UPI0020A423CF|nr:hypothetical protein [Actinomadura rupiterrae]MCP2343690.1 hypothetical protein [Actinomadura rupiterrae]